MCGIAGILHFDRAEKVDKARLAAMNETIAHRGPDGSGLWIEGPVGFAHRRLAILDVAAGQQPMANSRGDVQIVYNGEIYNHPDLKKKFETEGRVYRTTCDTESILHAYDAYSEGCVEHLQGMFGFAIWDAREEKLFLARDRVGIKPLYFARTERGFVFGSEIKVILASGWVKPELNTDAVPNYLATGSAPRPQTFFKNIYELEPGHTLVVDSSGDIRERSYWQIPSHPADRPGPSSPDAYADEVRDILTKTVRSHMLSDVPLGVFLSGGLDSSGIAALAAQHHAGPGKLNTFSVGFAEAEAHELKYARLAADAIGAEHRDVVVTPDDFFSALPKLIWHEDKPIAMPSSVPLYFVSELARKHVTVVLTGEGADELFLGYNRYRFAEWNMCGDALWQHLPRPLRGLTKTLASNLPGVFGRKAKRTFLVVEGGPRAHFCDNFAIFTEAAQKQMLASDRAWGDPHAHAMALYNEGQGSDLDRMSRVDLQAYLVELLMKQDRMSMAASIESRVPFLDHKLIERIVQLPNSAKLSGTTTKAVLRKALEGVVPASILTRKKMGFPVPLDRWFRGKVSHLMDDLVLSDRALDRGLFNREALGDLTHSHRRGAGNHGHRLWLLANLELWQRISIDGDAPSDISLLKAG